MSAANGVTKERVRLGVVGTGGIARTHLRALQALPGVDLAALCDLDEQRLGEAAAQWGTPETRTFTDYRRMLDEVRPDGVWVLVSVPATFAVTAECLRRGFDTLLEKPPGLRTGETRELAALADRHQHGDLPDSFHGIVEFQGGTVGQLISTYTSVPKIERLQLFGNQCWVVTEGIGSGMNTGRVYRDVAFADLTLPAEDIAGSDDFGYWAEDRFFVDCLRSGRPVAEPAATLQDAVVTMELVDTFLAGWK